MEDILHKFKFKGQGAVINAPADIEKSMLKLGWKDAFDKKIKSLNTLVFVSSKKEFVDFLTKQLGSIEPDSLLWFAYPKGTSGVKTDINRDIVHVAAKDFGLKTVTAVSIDNTWSAMRLRPLEKVGKK